MFLTDYERFLFKEGTWQNCWERLGAHPACEGGKSGYSFAVWAPGVKSVRIVGDFNNWNNAADVMLPDHMGEVWHLFVPGAKEGDAYKYVIETHAGQLIYKADPYAFWAEMPAGTNSRLYNIDSYKWHDGRWMSLRRRRNHRERPMNIYEVHLGSWRRHGTGERDYISYKEMTEKLVPYAAEMGYTHLELLPVMEHPFDGSWGYQVTGYYAPTARYGEPREFMEFVDACHNAGIAVILDWVPAHFCRDAHGLGAFTGEKLYEKGDHVQWGTYKFDYGRGEVRSFLTSNVLFWLKKYHADGIRVDGVTSMLYLNFDNPDAVERQKNIYGGEEDLEAVEFLRGLNRTVGQVCPDVYMMAEESTAWPLVTYPPEAGGLGFHYKWDMGWMHDTLDYLEYDFPFRPYHHNLLTFSMMYAFNENFVLALSHDEVVHGKKSLIGRMPGDYWRQFANLRVLALYQILHPGAKLNFMGAEIGQFIEWRYYEEIEWFLSENYDAHKNHQSFVRELNAFYKEQNALWEKSYSWDGFQWLDADNSAQSTLSFIRRGKQRKNDLVALINFCPETYSEYRIGVPKKGKYEEVFSSDCARFGGADMLNREPITAEPIPWQGQPYSVLVKVPPIGGLVLKRVPQKRGK